MRALLGPIYRVQGALAARRVATGAREGLVERSLHFVTDLATMTTIFGPLVGVVDVVYDRLAGVMPFGELDALREVALRALRVAESAIEERDAARSTGAEYGADLGNALQARDFARREVARLGAEIRAWQYEAAQQGDEMDLMSPIKLQGVLDRLVRERDHARASAQEAWREVQTWMDRERDARAKLALVATDVDGVWFWQGDGADGPGRDDPKSLACPVVLSADKLREILERAERSERVHRRAQRLEGVEARLERVRAGYERLVDYLYQRGARERSGARKRFREVHDALAGAGYPWGTPHSTRVDSRDGKPSYAKATELIGMLAAERDALRAERDALRERIECAAIASGITGIP